MRRFEVTYFADAPTLAQARAAMKMTFENGYDKGELEAELIGGLREVKPPKPCAECAKRTRAKREGTP